MKNLNDVMIRDLLLLKEPPDDARRPMWEEIHRWYKEERLPRMREATRVRNQNKAKRRAKRKRTGR